MRLKIEKVKWITERLRKMTIKKQYLFRDPVVERVVNKFVSRSDVGYAKYGTTLDEERRIKMKDLHKYLNDVQEELMDAILYIQSARDELQDLSEESLIDKFRDEQGDNYTYPEFREKYYEEKN